MRAPMVVLMATALAHAALAQDISVTIERNDAAQKCLASGEIIVRAGDVPDAERRTALEPGRHVYLLTLDSSRSWDVRVRADGCWSETVSWSAGSGSAIALRLHRAVSFGGTFEQSRGVRLSRLDAAVFFPADSGSRFNDGQPVSCSVDFPTWECAVPADVRFDLRLQPAGFATIHLWDLDVRRDSRHTSPLALRAGASLSGWVEDPGGRALANASVSLYPQEAETPGANRSRTQARRMSVRTSRRGFFQFTGLAAGQYQLVSTSEGLSPTNVPAIRLGEGEALVWPRAVKHVEPAFVEVIVQPPTTADGKPWIVAMEEETPLHLGARSTPTRRAAMMNGRWSAEGLRADVYNLSVEAEGGSVVEQLRVDVSSGGRHTVAVDVNRIRIVGRVLAGDEPLEAEVRFAHPSGKSIKASSDKDGRFEALFPVTGQWTPAIRPPGRRAATIDAEPVEIVLPADRPPSELTIILPGGRVRGTVVDASDQAVPAAVHVVRRGRPVAQQITTDDGEFDLIGIAAGTYTIDASGEHGATRQPVPIEVAEDDATELKLVLEPYREIQGEVLTPAGLPASGTVVRLSFDAQTWAQQVTDVRGRFRHRAPGFASDVWLVTNSHQYPSVINRWTLRGSEGLTIHLRAAGGILRIIGSPWPVVRAHDVAAPAGILLFPPPRGRFDGGLYLATGSYVVCPQREALEHCRTVTVLPNEEVTVDFRTPKDGD